MVMVMFMTLLLGLIVISIVVPLITNKVTDSTVTDDQFTASNTTCVEVAEYCIQTFSVVNASNGITTTGNFSVCAVSGQGRGLNMSSNDEANAWEMNGLTMNAIYTQRDCQPITGFTGTILTYVPVLMALLLLIFVAAFMK